MISKNLLKEIAYKQKKSLKLPDKLVSRVSGLQKSSLITIISGIRRGGKSTLLKDLMFGEGNFLYFNFEDENLVSFTVEDFSVLEEVLMEVYGEANCYFFDEIQNINGWERFIRRLHDEGKEIYLTGSNASMLSKELGSRLTGRYRQINLFPFSFKEFLEFYDFKETNLFLPENRAKIKKFFKRYVEEGGFPGFLQTRDEDYIKTLYDNILYRDIINRYEVRNDRAIKELFALILSNPSLPQTYNSLKKTVGVSNANTIKEYLFFAEQAYLFFELRGWNASLKKQMHSPKKIYLVDTALHDLGVSLSPNKGRLLENVVFLQLKRENKEIYYHKEKYECDFVIRKRKIAEAIQVCYDLGEDNKVREINGLVEACKNHKLKEGILLTYDQEDEFTRDNVKIKVKPVWKWLVERQRN